MNKYMEIYLILKERIINNEYSEMLPSENTLSKSFDVSRNTVRRAIKLLENDGFVVSKHGKGMFILEQIKDDFFLAGVESFAEVMKRTNKKFTTKVIEFKRVLVDQELSLKTGLPIDTMATKIVRIRHLNTEPIIIDINYFAFPLTEGLTNKIAEKSIYDFLENDLELEIKLSKRKIYMDFATEFDYENLVMNEYNMVAILQNKVFLSNGKQLEYTESRHRPDIFSFIDISTRQ